MDVKNFVYNFSVLTLGTCAVIILILALVPVKISKKGILNFFSILILSLAVFSFFAEPSVSTDLYRHYIWMDNFEDYIKGNRALVIWNFMMWVVIQTGSNGFLPAGCIIIWGYLIKKIIGNYLSENEYSAQAVFLYFMSLFSGCALYYIISGIRSTLVSAVVAYAYYILRTNSKTRYYLLIIFASLIHVFALVLFLIIEVYERFIKGNSRTAILKVILVVFAVTLLINSSLTINFLQLIPGSYGSLLVSRWNLYLQYVDRDTLENSFRFFYVAFFLIITIINIIKNRKIKFFDWLIIVAICASPMMIFFERMPYFIGICSLTSINESFINFNGVKRIVFQIALYFIAFMFLFFFVYTLFAHVNFNGHSYYEFWRGLVK